MTSEEGHHESQTPCPTEKRRAPTPLSEGGRAREKRLQGVPPKHRPAYRRAWDGNSRKSAIRAFCLECVGWSENEVRLCRSVECPLYKYRLQG